jgi:hypothetical protein
LQRRSVVGQSDAGAAEFAGTGSPPQAFPIHPFDYTIHRLGNFRDFGAQFLGN